ncbi:hypothetical protein [Streptomyces sp. AC555_RSS877]|uniref:hypothetical protein n=1 Tax=Streptomyces sp. AC555_RSS877 TaxID=2823688 RepID=UPI001C274D71|nr:hypothetical protein [Streptomyces sp. AC555_RSS877]
MAHTFEDLVKLEQAAEAARALLDSPDVDHDAQWQAWRKAAADFQTAVTGHAKDEGKPRVEVEMAAKKAVRHTGA